MKTIFFGLGLSMVLSLGACAAPYGEDGAGEPREETVKSAETADALEALRSRVQDDFATAPSMRGSQIVLAVSRVEDNGNEIAIHAHVTKRNGMGIELDLEDVDIAGAALTDVRVVSRQRTVSAILAKGEDGEWSTLKNGILGSRAVEAYVVGQSTEAFEGWAKESSATRSRSARTPL